MLAMLAGSANAALYRWVDKDGRVHYSDKVPPKASKLERKELSKQGLTRRVHQAQKTPEQLAAERRQNELDKLAKEKAERQAYQDRILIQTYNSVNALEKTRDEKILTIENLIELTEGVVKGLEVDLNRAMQKAARMELQGVAVDKKTQGQIDKVKSQIKEKTNLIAIKKEEQQQTRVKFARDILRFKELTGQI